MNKDPVQFPLHFAKYMNENLSIAARTPQPNGSDFKVARVSGFFSFLRYLSKSGDKTVILYFLSSKTKLRCIVIHACFPSVNIVIKADQDENSFQVAKHMATRRTLLRAPVRSLLNRLFYRAIRQICVETKSVHKVLSSLPETRGKIFLMPNGSSCVPKIENKKDLIVFIGRYQAPQKNFALFNEAIQASLSVLDEWQVDVIGGTDKPSGTNQMSFLGTLQHSQTMERLAEAKVLALSSEYEGSPIVFAEAKAAGCAILTTDVSSARDFVANGADGEIAQINLPDYAEKLKKIVDRCNRDDFDFLAIQQRYLDEFDWDKNCRALADKIGAAANLN